MKLEKKLQGNKSAAITKKQPLIKRRGLIIAAVVVGMATLILGGLRLWADTAANRFAEEKAAYLTAVESTIGTTAEAYEKIADPHGDQLASAEKAFMTMQKAIKGRQTPYLQTVWLGQFLSSSYKAASEQSTTAAAAKEEALKVMHEVYIHVKYQQQMANILRNAALSAPVKEASSAEAAKTAWLAASEAVRKLKAPVRIINHHQELAMRLASVGEQLGVITELYKQGNRDDLQVANDELAVRLQSARASAEPLKEYANQLDVRLKVVLQKL